MTPEAKFVLLMSIPFLFSLYYGINGIIDNQRINVPSKVYMNINISITGILGTLYLIIASFYIGVKANRFTDLEGEKFFAYSMLWFLVISLVSSIHGYIYKDKIKNHRYYKMTVRGFIIAFMILSALIAWNLRWGWPY